MTGLDAWFRQVEEQTKEGTHWLPCSVATIYVLNWISWLRSETMKVQDLLMAQSKIDGHCRDRWLSLFDKSRLAEKGACPAPAYK